jgi:hypothetical protein
MKHIGIGFGGLKGYAYVKSLEAFTKEIISENDTENRELKELIRTRADKITKGVYTLESAIRSLDKSAPKAEKDLIRAQDIPELTNLEGWGEDIIYENNTLIIRYLSQIRAGRMRDPYTLEEQAFLQRLHNQIAFLATKSNQPHILNKLTK